MCDEVAKVLGLDWVLLFLQPGLHSSTVVWGLRILVAVCSVQSILIKFREGTSNGGWLRHTDHNKVALALGKRYFFSRSRYVGSLDSFFGGRR